MTESFPTAGILPKHETQASAYLKQWPEYDGRGVIVAIFDTGIDPGAPGLQVTTDGKPKIIDIVDCSGSGDVDTSTIKESKDSLLVGLSGRSLTLGGWDNPSGKYHVGVKRVHELYPQGLTPRIKKERKEQFDIKQRESVAALQREISEWKQAEGKPSKKELEGRLEQLTSLSYEDLGSVIDVIAFQDSKGVWRVVLDKNEDGDLTKVRPLADYSVAQEYDTFSEKDLLNYSVKIYNNGNVCCLVTNAGAHGTHVAGIVAGNFPEQPELNGIAPGAQLIAVKIGDTRLGSMETGTSMVRGLIAAKKWNADLINMSYGEPTNRPNIGRFPSLAAEFVNNHKIIFVASAGNNGPCLGTVGAPGGTTTDLIGVGAMVSPDMMRAEYALREDLPETQYTWSSRGPADDGSLGVCISAPGGAIAPVPNWTLKKAQLMNGTSMSSPNACGNIALMISGLKATKTRYTPQSIRLAIENTAKVDPSRDHWTQGHGLIQVQKAFEYAMKFSADSTFRLSVTGNDRRGVYLKEVLEVSRLQEITVKVEPIFYTEISNAEKVKLERRLNLEATVPWVKSPQNLLLTNEEKSFKITVDPTELGTGPHFGYLNIIDSETPSAGPIGQLPVTVIKPIVVKDAEAIFEKLSYEPGKIKRMFFAIPTEASWAKVTIKSHEVHPKRLFVLQWRQSVPHQSLKTTMNEEYLWLEGSDQRHFQFHVSGGHVVEVVLAQYWSALGTEGTLDFKIEFHAVPVENLSSTLQLTAAENLAVKISAPLRAEKILPKAVLAVVNRRIVPTSSVIAPLDPSRDLLPDGKQIYSCINTYTFSISDGATVLTRVPGFDQMLYDSPHEAQFWMIFDENKQRVHVGDYQPEAVSLSRKGKYTVRVLFRHDNLEYLKQLKNLTLLLERHLPKDKQVSLSLYASIQDAIVGGTKYSSKAKTLQRGETSIVVIAPPAESKLPKDLESGDVVKGYIIFRDTTDSGESVPDSVGKKGLEIPTSGQFLEFLYLKPSADSPSKKERYSLEDSKSAAENFEETLQQHGVDYVSFLVKKAKFDHAKTLLSDLLKKYPEYLPLLKQNMLFHDKLAQDGKGEYAAVVEAADLVISRINVNELALHFGTRHEDEDTKGFDTKKETLISALHHKARAYHAMIKKTKDDKLKEPFFAAMTELNKWAKVSEENKYAVEYIASEKLRGNLASALKAIKKRFTTSNDKEVFLELVDLLGELGWKHWQENHQSRLLSLFPSAYPPF